MKPQYTIWLYCNKDNEKYDSGIKIIFRSLLWFIVGLGFVIFLLLSAKGNYLQFFIALIAYALILNYYKAYYALNILAANLIFLFIVGIILHFWITYELFDLFLLIVIVIGLLEKKKPSIYN